MRQEKQLLKPWSNDCIPGQVNLSCMQVTMHAYHPALIETKSSEEIIVLYLLKWYKITTTKKLRCIMMK